ncbi:MAG: rRNA maturation RNase YbeY, partial [Bilophila sp.]
MSLHITLSGGQLCWRLPLCRTELFHALENMAQVVTCEPLELDLLLVRDGTMAKLNQQHMGCQGATNVLSFPLDEWSTATSQEYKKNTTALGSLVLSVDALHREALLYGQELEEHCLRLLAHGMGHLAGYDHS